MLNNVSFYAIKRKAFRKYQLIGLANLFTNITFFKFPSALMNLFKIFI